MACGSNENAQHMLSWTQHCFDASSAMFFLCVHDDFVRPESILAYQELLGQLSHRYCENTWNIYGSKRTDHTKGSEAVFLSVFLDLKCVKGSSDGFGDWRNEERNTFWFTTDVGENNK